MKLTERENELQYGIKYKVSKLGEDRYLLYPICLLKGYDDGVHFKTDKETLPYAQMRDDFNNPYVIDMVYYQDELEYVYDYEGDSEFLGDFFFEDHKDTIIFASTQDDCVTKIDFSIDLIGNQSNDAVFCMDKSYPAVLLNNKAVEELLKCKTDREREVILRKYQDKLKSFENFSRNKKITRIYTSDGKMDYIDTLRPAPDVEKEIERVCNEEIEKMDNNGSVKSSDISYKGLKEYIKERVYGHNEEIDVIAQKLYMNYTAEEGETIESILIVGPTGTGKTETVKAACSYLNIPSYQVNASNIVPQGIRGMSIEDVIIGLYEKADHNLKRAQKGIIFLDEFDKLNDCSSSEIKEPVKSILLTFTEGGNFPIDNDHYRFNFNSAMTTKIYAGVFDRITEKIKSLGFNNVLEFQEALGSSEEIRKKIIDKKYFTLEELSRISTIVAYEELDRETKKQILMGSKLSEYIKKKERYRRQFGIDLVASCDYIDEILDSSVEGMNGMRSINNYVKRTIDAVEQSILDGDIGSHKKLILTKKTVLDPKNFELK